MQRVNLGKPYEEYIKRMVKGGYYASASEVLRDAVSAKMNQPSVNEPKKSLAELVEEGLDDVKAGRVVPYTKEILKGAYKKAIENSKKGKPVSAHIRP
jgi:putative addiction module CopG family antidote